jgi:hypothetical protein
VRNGLHSPIKAGRKRLLSSVNTNSSWSRISFPEIDLTILSLIAFFNEQGGLDYQ